MISATEPLPPSSAQMNDVPLLEALDIHLEAAEDENSDANQRLAQRALSRVCRGPVMEIPVEALEEMSASALLEIVCWVLYASNQLLDTRVTDVDGSHVLLDERIST